MAVTEQETPGLSDETIAIVTSTAPVLEEHGLAITTRLYERLFMHHPETKALFGEAAPDQAERLAGAVLAYAQNVENIEPLVPVVTAIAEKHVAAGVEPHHYEIVGVELLASMIDVLGGLDEAIVDAWASAYGYLANIFIGIEAQMVTQ